MNILEKGKLLLLVQKAINDISAEELCEFIDKLAEFIGKNIGKNVEGGNTVASHIATSEPIKNMIVHLIQSGALSAVKFENNPKVKEGVEFYTELINSLGDQLEAVTA